MRDWSQSLWPGSWKGVPFYIERDSESGGLRLAVHRFPHRDEPFVEDMGEDERTYDVNLYLISDSSDSEALALSRQFVSHGAGVLVLPFGPVQAKCHKFTRTRERDRQGYVAFSAKFIREGAASALVSADFLGNLAFAALDALTGAVAAVNALAGAAAALAAGSGFSAQSGANVAAIAQNASGAGAQLLAQADVAGRPGWIAAAAAAGAQNILISLEVLRATVNGDTGLTGAVHNDLAVLYNAIPGMVSFSAGIDVSLAPQLFALSRRLGAALDPAAAIQGFASALDAVPQPPGPQPGQTALRQVSAGNDAVIARLTRAVLLAGYGEALLHQTFADRPSAITARANLVARIEPELNYAQGGRNGDVYVALSGLRGALVEYLSRQIIDLAPVLTVTANASMPVLWWAWRLYGDPARAQELIERNNVKHPSHMPAAFEALAPARAA